MRVTEGELLQNARIVGLSMDARLTSGYKMLAWCGDTDFEDAPKGRRDWRPAPSEDCDWKAQVVDAAWSKYREGQQ